MRACHIGLRIFLALLITGCIFTSVAAAAEANQVVQLRAGDHKTYLRLAFEWPRKITYQAVIKGRELRINFDRPFTADTTVAMRKLAQFIETPVMSKDGVQMRIALRRTFVLQTRQFDNVVVIDLLKDVTNKKNPPQKIQAIAKADPVKPSPEMRLAHPPVSLAAPPKSAAVISQRSAAELEADRQRIEEQAKLAERAQQDAIIAAGLAQAAAEAQEKQPVVDKDGVTGFDMRVKALPNGLRLRFPFQHDVAAAIFFRGPILWVVFDKPSRVGLPLVALTNNAILSAVDQIEEEEFTALAFKVAPGYFARLDRRRSIWQIDLIREAVLPNGILPVVREPEADAGALLHVRSGHPAGPYRVLDPRVGDSMLVTPVMEVGYGVLESRRYVDFELMKTLQGVAIVPFTDQLQVKAAPGLVSIGAPAGLHMSDEMARLLGKNSAGSAIPQPPMFMDFDRWRRGDDAKFTETERQLRADVASAVLAKRAAYQKTLAQFYLAHGLAVESHAVLQIMASENAAIVKDIYYRGLMAISNYTLGRYKQAEKELPVLELQHDPHLLLWRGAIRARLAKWEPALMDFDSGFSVLGKYPAAIQTEMRLLVASAALIRGEYDRAERELAAAPAALLPLAQASLAMLLRGQLLEARGKDDSALKAYDNVIADHYRPTEVQARLAKLLLFNKLGTIDNARAIEQLETLRYAWRNDGVEMKVLEALGERYIANNNFRDGLSVMRNAVTYFPNSEQARRITDRMSEIFADLFLHGGSEELPPIKALALYYDFRELTPLGSDGDEMIRRLGERLVAVDLLDEAIELLDHQVRNRLVGTAKAQVATRLAVIQLLDKRPAKALESIRHTRQTRLPEDLTLRRLMLEARALTELSKFAQALELIAGLTTHEANLLRADIYWAAQDWPQAAASLQTVLGERWRAPEALDPAAQAQVMRAAIAYALVDKQAELDQLRAHYLPKMAGNPYTDGFAVITQSPAGRGIAFRQLAGTIAGIDTLKDFMASYRRDL